MEMTANRSELIDIWIITWKCCPNIRTVCISLHGIKVNRLNKYSTYIIQFRIRISLLGFQRWPFSYFTQRVVAIKCKQRYKRWPGKWYYKESFFYTLFAVALPLSISHTKTITKASHKFIKCQRKADRRKNNDIMRI